MVMAKMATQMPLREARSALGRAAFEFTVGATFVDIVSCFLPSLATQGDEATPRRVPCHSLNRR